MSSEHALQLTVYWHYRTHFDWLSLLQQLRLKNGVSTCHDAAYVLNSD